VKQTYNSGMISGRSAAVRFEGDVNGALRRLKKTLERDKQQRELMEREYFEKPSVTKQRIRAAGKKRRRMDRLKQISQGLIQPKVPSNLKYLKSRRTRRVVIDERAAWDRALRNRAKQPTESY
jgi:ribosomal protein S21